MKAFLAIAVLLTVFYVANATVPVYVSSFTDANDPNGANSGSSFISVMKKKGENPYRLTLYSLISSVNAPTSAYMGAIPGSPFNIPNYTLSISTIQKKGNIVFSTIQFQTDTPRLFQNAYIQVNETFIQYLQASQISIYATYNNGTTTSTLTATPNSRTYARRYLTEFYNNQSNHFVGFVIATTNYYNRSTDTFDLYSTTKAFFSSLGTIMRATTYTNDSSTITSLGWYYRNGTLISTFTPRSANPNVWDLTSQPWAQKPTPTGPQTFYDTAFSHGLTQIVVNLSNGQNYTGDLINTEKYLKRNVPTTYAVTTGTIRGNVTRALTAGYQRVGKFRGKDNHHSYISLVPDASGNFNATFDFPPLYSNPAQGDFLIEDLIIEANLYQKAQGQWNFIARNPNNSLYDPSVSGIGYYNHTGTWDYVFQYGYNAFPQLLEARTPFSIQISTTGATAPLLVDMLTLRLGVAHAFANPHSPAF